MFNFIKNLTNPKKGYPKYILFTRTFDGIRVLNDFVVPITNLYAYEWFKEYTRIDMDSFIRPLTEEEIIEYKTKGVSNEKIKT